MIAEKAPPAELLEHICGIIPHITEGKSLAWELILADLAGWDVSRAKIAFQVAEHAGYLSNGSGSGSVQS